MLVRGRGWFAILLALSLSTASAAEQCRLTRLAAIPVTMVGWRPTIPAELNGHQTRLLVDTGAFFDALSPAEATEFNLPIRGAAEPFPSARGWSRLPTPGGGQARWNLERE